MRDFWVDLRYAVRQLGRSWGFTATSVLSLMLGIGATAAVFSVIWGVLIDPFPYPTADRIMRLVLQPAAGPTRGVRLNAPQLRQLQQAPLLAGVLVLDGWSLTLTGEDLPESVEVGYVSTNSFHDLGVPMLMGRGLAPSDGIDGQEPQPVCVISWRFWHRHFGGNPAALGKTLDLGHKKYTVVSIAPQRFTCYSEDVYMPLKLTSDPAPVYVAMVLLKPGVTKVQADAALQPLFDEFARQT